MSVIQSFHYVTTVKAYISLTGQLLKMGFDPRTKLGLPEDTQATRVVGVMLVVTNTVDETVLTTMKHFIFSDLIIN